MCALNRLFKPMPAVSMRSLPQIRLPVEGVE